MLAELLRPLALRLRQRPLMLERPGRLRPHGLQLLQPLIPAPLELPRDRPMLRLDRQVLPLGPLRLVLRLLDLQPPGRLGRGDLLAQLFVRQRRRLSAPRRRHLQEGLDHGRLDPLAAHQLALAAVILRGPATAIL